MVGKSVILMCTQKGPKLLTGASYGCDKVEKTSSAFVICSYFKAV